MGTWGWVGVGGLVMAVVLAVTCGSKGRRGGSRRSGSKSGSRKATKFVASKDRKMDSQRRLGVTYMREAVRLQTALMKALSKNDRKAGKKIVVALARLEEKINKLRLRGAALAA